MEFNRFASYLEQTFKTEKLNYEAFCAVNRTKLHLECFTSPWQPRQPPGGFSKTAPHTAYKEVHLAPPLSGISWPTLNPACVTNRLNSPGPPSPPIPARHHISSAQTSLGRVHRGGPRRLKHVLGSPLVRLHSAGVMTPSVAPSAARRTHTWGTSGDSGHLGHLDGGGSSMAQ